MHILFTSLCFGAVLALPLTTTAVTPDGADPVAASFARMLDHAPVTTAPKTPTGYEDDPLHTYLTTVLWERQPAQCGLDSIEIAAMDRRIHMH